MNRLVSIYAIFTDGAEAERIARMVIEERLAACANILAPSCSIYRWQGVIETAEEVPALFKTTDDRAPALIDRIAELHSYDTPAIVAWPVVATDQRYADWVTENTAVS